MVGLPRPFGRQPTRRRAALITDIPIRPPDNRLPRTFRARQPESAAPPTVAVSDQGVDFAGEQINPGQQAKGIVGPFDDGRPVFFPPRPLDAPGWVHLVGH
jgi:hypothetical protein